MRIIRRAGETAGDVRRLTTHGSPFTRRLTEVGWRAMKTDAKPRGFLIKDPGRPHGKRARR